MKARLAAGGGNPTTGQRARPQIPPATIAHSSVLVKASCASAGRFFAGFASSYGGISTSVCVLLPGGTWCTRMQGGIRALQRATDIKGSEVNRLALSCSFSAESVPAREAQPERTPEESLAVRRVGRKCARSLACLTPFDGARRQASTRPAVRPTRPDRGHRRQDQITKS